MMGTTPLDFGPGGMEADGGRRMLSPEDALMPPLTMQDRHPSAPQLASMLTSSVDNHKMSDMAMGLDDSVKGGFINLWAG